MCFTETWQNVLSTDQHVSFFVWSNPGHRRVKERICTCDTELLAIRIQPSFAYIKKFQFYGKLLLWFLNQRLHTQHNHFRLVALSFH